MNSPGWKHIRMEQSVRSRMWCGFNPLKKGCLVSKAETSDNLEMVSTLTCALGAEVVSILVFMVKKCLMRHSSAPHWLANALHILRRSIFAFTDSPQSATP